MKIIAMFMAYLCGLFGGWYLRRIIELRSSSSDKPATNEDGKLFRLKYMGRGKPTKYDLPEE